MADAPIIPMDFLYGIKVVDIGDVRVSRGLSRRPFSSCRHKQMVYDDKERRIFCADCETDVEPFDAFKVLTEQYGAACQHLNERSEKVKQAEAFTIRSRAARVMDEAWRRTSMLPCCPHCKRGIAAQDVVKGVAQVSKDFEMARREAGQKGCE